MEYQWSTPASIVAPITMESPNTKSAHKFVKTSSESPVLWNSFCRGIIAPAMSSVETSKIRRKLEAGNSRDEVKGRPTDKSSKGSLKPHMKDNTRTLEIKLHTEQRAVKRAMFNYSVAAKLYLMEQQKKQTEKLVKMIEEEEIRMLRKEMIPRAQLMPLFDRPFFPQRSTRPLTIPREPSLHMLGNKSWNRTSCSEHYNFPGSQAVNPIK